MLHTNQAIRDGQVAMNGTLTGQVTSEEVTVNLEGVREVRQGEVRGSLSLVVDADQVTPRYELPVFTELTPDTPAVIRRFETLGGAVQVAVMMPQGMEVEDMTVVVAGSETVSLGRPGKVITKRARVVISAGVFEEVKGDVRG